MLRSLRIALFFLSFTLLGLPAQSQTFFTAKFSPEQESHDVTSAGTGTATLALSGNELKYFITVEGLSGPITAAHFHTGETGSNGAPARSILNDFTGNSASGSWTSTDTEPLTPELIAELFAGNLYLNVHTAAFAAGELRAQVIPTDGATLSADLTPEQEPHEVNSLARGTAIVQMTGSGAAFFVTVDGLSGSIANAHFHNAAAGANGGPVRSILADFDGNTAFGVWTADDAEPLTVDLLVEALKGNLYLNIHTAAYGAGEVRGQLFPTGWAFQASLDASQADGSTGTGSGTAALVLTPQGLAYDITVTGLTGDLTGAHFHNAPAGQGGGVVRPITSEFTDNTASGVWSFDETGGLSGELLAALVRGELYLNIHTAANAAGEIRGQILSTSGTALNAHLTPEQVTTEITQAASGTAFVFLTDEGVSYEVTVDGLSGSMTAAHFHRAPMGVNGSVVKTIGTFVDNHATGTWTTGDATQPLTDELISALLQGQMYINVHTSANGGGEIRGQVMLSGATVLRAALTTAQETHDVTQNAAGTASLLLTEAGLVYNATVNGLSGAVTGSHFHNDEAGTDGGVVHNITSDFVGNTVAGFWPAGEAMFSTALRNELLAGNLYLNVHTDANAAGELRGQVYLASGLGSGVDLSPGQHIGVVTSDGRGSASLNLSPEGLTFDLTVNGLTGDITNAHFHNAPVRQNGGVVRGIAEEFEGLTAFGVWRLTDVQPFSVDRLVDLINAELYLNVHTAANTGGEIRGQIGAGEFVGTAVEQLDDAVPSSFSLAQNYPNPFNPSTTIRFDLTQASTIRLSVYNVLGQLVQQIAEGPFAPGSYQVTFDATDLPSGMYTYRLENGARTETKAMLLVK